MMKSNTNLHSACLFTVLPHTLPIRLLMQNLNEAICSMLSFAIGHFACCLMLQRRWHMHAPQLHRERWLS